MNAIFLFFLAAVPLLYALLGGADLGAGIIEIFTPKKYRSAQKKIISDAMGPVWEANHVWLVVLVVIVFVGIPETFFEIMTALYCPILAFLIGVIFRGTAFAFRHFDVVQDEKSQRVFGIGFNASSVWMAFWIGVISTSEISVANGSATASSGGVFQIASGIFCICFFAFWAGVLFVRETNDSELRQFFARRAKWSGAIAALAFCAALAACLLGKTPGTSIALLMLFAGKFAPATTVAHLAVALLVASCLIFPSLFFLLKTFQKFSKK